MGHRATFEIWVVSRSGKYIKSRDCRATRRNGVKLGCSCGGGGGGSRSLCSCLRDVYDSSDQDCTVDAWDVRVDIRAVSSISNLGLVVFCLGHDELLVPEKAGVTERRSCCAVYFGYPVVCKGDYVEELGFQVRRKIADKGRGRRRESGLYAQQQPK